MGCSSSSGQAKENTATNGEREASKPPGCDFLGRGVTPVRDGEKESGDLQTDNGQRYRRIGGEPVIHLSHECRLTTTPRHKLSLNLPTNVRAIDENLQGTFYLGLTDGPQLRRHRAGLQFDFTPEGLFTKLGCERTTVAEGQLEMRFKFELPLLRLCLEGSPPSAHETGAYVREVVVGLRVVGSLKSAAPQASSMEAGLQGQMLPPRASVSVGAESRTLSCGRLFDLVHSRHGGVKLDTQKIMHQPPEKIIQYLEEEWAEQSMRKVNLWEHLYFVPSESTAARERPGLTREDRATASTAHSAPSPPAVLQPSSSPNPGKALTDLEKRTIEMLEGVDDTPAGSICQDDSGKPLGANCQSVFIVGLTGAGKSSFSALLSGTLARSDEVGGNLGSDLFPLGHTADPMTNTVTHRTFHWFGDHGQEEISVLDTPGLQDPRPGKDEEHMTLVGKKIQGLHRITALMIVWKGNEVRVDLSVRQMLTLLQDLLGANIWNNVAIVVNRWGHDKRSKDQRQKGRSMKEADFEENIRSVLLKPKPLATQDQSDREGTTGLGLDAHVAGKIPFFFIDTHFDPDCEDEKKSMEAELTRLKLYVQSKESIAPRVELAATISQEVRWLVNAIRDKSSSGLRLAIMATHHKLTPKKLESVQEVLRQLEEAERIEASRQEQAHGEARLQEELNTGDPQGILRAMLEAARAGVRDTSDVMCRAKRELVPSAPLEAKQHKRILKLQQAIASGSKNRLKKNIIAAEEFQLAAPQQDGGTAKILERTLEDARLLLKEMEQSVDEAYEMTEPPLPAGGMRAFLQKCGLEKYSERLAEVGVTNLLGLQLLSDDELHEKIGIEDVVDREKLRVAAHNALHKQGYFRDSNRQDDDSTATDRESGSAGQRTESSRRLWKRPAGQALGGRHRPDSPQLGEIEDDGDSDSSCESRFESISWQSSHTRDPTQSGQQSPFKHTPVSHHQPSSLHEAAQLGNVAAARRFLEQGTPVDVTVEDGKTALHLAATFGQGAIVELLAKSRGDVNRHKARTRTTSAQVRINDVVLGQVSEEIKDEEDEYTPLHFATASQSIPAMSALLACRADPTRAAKAYPPLHMAAATGTETLIDALVQGKANLEQKGKFGETAIFSAASKNKASTLQQLLDYRASPDVSSNGGFTVMHYAARDGALDCVKVLMHEYKVSPRPRTDRKWTPLALAVKNDRAEVVEFLLGCGLDPSDIGLEERNDEGVLPLHLAATKDSARACECATLLLNGRANPNAAQTSDGWMPLHLASRDSSSQMCQLLLQSRADARAQKHDGWTALHLASANGKESIVRVLLESPAARDIQQQANHKGALALHHACAKDDPAHHAIAAMLLECGSPVDVVDAAGNSPLHLAVEADCMEVVQKLVAKRADVSVQNNDRQTSLARAANSYKITISTFLIKNMTASALNLGDSDKETVLHVLCRGHRHRQPELIQQVNALIAARAAVNPKNKVGWTPLHHATKQGLTQVVDVLLSFKADTTLQKDDGYSALHLAICNDHMDEGEHILADVLRKGDRGVLDAQANDGYTYLTMALDRGHLQMAKQLVEANADVNKCFLPSSETSQQPDIAQMLLGLISKETWKAAKWSPLHFACRLPEAAPANEMVQLLLHRRADVKAKGEDGLIAADVAKRKGHRQLALTLGGAQHPPPPAAGRGTTDTQGAQGVYTGEGHRLSDSGDASS